MTQAGILETETERVYCPCGRRLPDIGGKDVLLTDRCPGCKRRYAIASTPETLTVQIRRRA